MLFDSSSLSALAGLSPDMDPEAYVDTVEAAPAPLVRVMLLQMKKLLQSADSNEQRAGACSIMVLTARERICSYALEIDVIKLLVHLARTAADLTPGTAQEPPIAGVAIGGLSNFTNFDHTEAVVSAGAIPHVVRFLPRSTGLADVYTYGCLKVLADSLREHESAAQQAEAAGLIHHLKPHLTSQHDASKQCAAACAYHLLRQCPGAVPDAVSSGYVPPLASLLNHDDPETIFNAEGAMLRLARCTLPAAQQAISSSGAIRTLSQRCLSHSDVHVRHMAAGVLMCMATGTLQRQDIIDAGALQPLMVCMQQAQHPDLQQGAAECLYNIAAGGCIFGHQLVAAGVLQPLMAMLRGSTDGDVLHAGSCLGACLCGCQHNRPEVLPVVLQEATAADSSSDSNSSSRSKAGDESSTGAALVLASMVLDLGSTAARVVVDCGGVRAMVAVRACTQVPYAQRRLDQALQHLEGMGDEGCAAAVSSAREEVRVLQQAQAQGAGAGGKARGKGSSGKNSSSSGRHADDISRGGSSGGAAAGGAAGAASSADQAVAAPAAAAVVAADAAASAAHVCAKCGTAGRETIKLHRCAGCKGVRYCSKECQKSHWKVHKPACTAKPGT